MINQEQTPQPVYFKSLTIQGVNCFKSEQTIDLSNGKGEPAMWTVILGNNNTGKTTVLRCLAELEPTEDIPNKSFSPRFIPNGFIRNSSRSYFSLNASIFFKNTIINDQWGGTYRIVKDKNGYSATISSAYNTFSDISIIPNFIIDAYGTQRKEGKGSHIEYKLTDRTESLFKDDVESIINAEEWFLGTTLDSLLGNKKATENLENIKKTLVDILPDIQNIEIGKEIRRLHFITKSGEKVLVNQLGSGYQSLVTWVVDFAKRMFDRYPESPNPLAEPAIVLVDEIDLHLHPEWQRKIVAFLREKFPKTQFIVTAHSPLVIQSADDINVVVLQKNDETDDVEVYQPAITNFQGWTVEEILSDLMGMGDKVYSNEYLKWIKQFDTALDSDNYESAKEAYDQLEKMVHSSATLKMLRMQMSSLMPKSHD